MQFNKLIPELSVTNIKRSKDFYLKLGFKICYERKENSFCFLELEGNQLMLEEINDNWNVGKLEYPLGRGINISMSINNIDVYYQKIITLGYPLFKDLTINNYCVGDNIFEDKEFLIQDPDGYLLRFNN